MAIVATCTKCGVKLRYRSEHAGKTAKCRACDARIVVEGDTVPDHDVFVSYSFKDIPVADAVCAALEEKRIRCWIAPRDVLAGKPWAGAILDAIAEARVMVLIYSANSNESPQVIREVDRAVHNNSIIVPFRIDATPLSKEMEYYISSAHWLDATSPPIEPHVKTLVSTVKLLLGSNAPTVARRARAAGAPGSSGMRRPVLIGVTLSVCVAIGVAIGAYRGRVAGVSGVENPQAQRPLPASTPSAGVEQISREAAGALPAEPPQAGPATVDVLALARVPEDVFGGNWTRSAAGFTSDAINPCRLCLPYSPKGEYDLYVEVEFQTDEHELTVYLGKDGTNVVWWMKDRDASRTTSLGFVDNGKFYHSRKAGKASPTGSRLTLLFRVREDSVASSINDVPAGRWKVDYATTKLWIGSRVNLPPGNLGIGTAGPTLVRSVKLIPVLGQK